MTNPAMHLSMNQPSVEHLINSTPSSTQAVNKPSKKPFTPEDLIATANLQRLWNEYKIKYINEHGIAITQAKAAREMDWTQSNFSQYLNGIVPIGIKAAQRIAKLFSCKMSDIHPDYRDNEAIAERDDLKSKLNDILEILDRLSKGETDIDTVQRVAQSIVDSAGARVKEAL